MDFPSFLPERSFEDIIGERVRLTVGGREYILPAKSVEDNEAWLDALQSDFDRLMSALMNPENDMPAVVALLTGNPDWLIDHLVSYDHTGALPGKAAIRKGLTPMQLLMAIAEVWRAANPLVDTPFGRLPALTSAVARSGSSPPMRSRQRNTAGRPATSARN